MTDNVSEYQRFTRRMLIAVSVVAAIFGLFVLLWHLAEVLLAVFAAVLFAVWLDGLALLVSQRTRIGRGWALLMVILVLLVGIGSFGMLAGTQVSDQLSQLGQRVPIALDQLRSLVDANSWGHDLLARIPAPRDWVPSDKDILGQLSGVFSTAIGTLVNAVIVVLIGFYLAIKPKQYVDNVVRLLPTGKRPRGRQVLHYLGHALRWWLVGRMAAMAVVGVLTGVALWLAGTPLVLALALIAALLSFVPFVGPVMAAVPAVLIAFLQSPFHALYVLGIYTVVQFAEGNFITPMIQERAVSLPPAALLTAQLLMGVLFGVFGIVLATPLAVAIIVLVQMLYVEDVLGDHVEVLGERHRAL
jgi:predicted PurR-regulated permease PerM